MTRAYNLPARRVIHTVGPIAGGRPSDRHRDELARCYTACLDAAAGEGLGAHPSACLRVIFNVFLDEDAAIYRRLFSA